MAIYKDEITAANDRAPARLVKTPTAVAARFDRRIGRVVIDLSTGLEIAFKPHDAQGLEQAKPNTRRRSKFHHPASVCTSQRSMPTFFCRHCSKDSWVRAPGW